jgi:replicative DNA helicase
MSTPLLYDIEAEECVLGACLLSSDAVETALGALVEADFGVPTHASTFRAVRSLHDQGWAIDWKSVTDELRSQGADVAVARLADLQAGVPSLGSVPRYCDIVARFALRRRLAGEAAALATAARDLTKDPGGALDAHRASLLEIDSPLLAGDPDDLDVADFLTQPVAERAPWVIPGLLRVGHRVIVTAPEGVGKSTFLRQLGMLPAFGIHPLTFTPIEPVPTLIVDLENPADVVQDALRRLVDQAERWGGSSLTASLWLKPGGINVRTRRDRLAFENVLRRHKPPLVAFGPIYKAYTRKANETDEQVASEVQAILDDLRTRYGFALVAEHHAPKAQHGYRDLVPFGSSLWLRWPEVGLKLVPGAGDKRDILTVGRWRRDRTATRWPDQLHRDRQWPFVGYYAKGIDHEGGVDDGDDR